MTVLVAGIFTASPVCGFRPIRGARFRRSNVPNPESDTRWPFATVSLIEAMAASTTRATEALAMSVRLATSETSPRLFTVESVYVGEARRMYLEEGSLWHALRRRGQALALGASGPEPLWTFSRNVSRRDGVQSYCTECRRDYLKKHYARNIVKYRAAATVRDRVRTQQQVD